MSEGVARPLLVALALLCGLLAGCASDPDDSALGDGNWEKREEVHLLLEQRARAVREDDMKSFLQTLDRSNRGLVNRQRRLFRNLQKLPVSTFRYEVLTRMWPHVLADPAWGKDVFLPQVELSQQLGSYDERPVKRLEGFAFGYRGNRMVIISDRTRAGKFFPDTRPEPWERVRIKVRRTGAVLGVYDAGSWSSSQQVNDVVSEGVAQLQTVLPYDWSGRVIVYEFTDDRVLESFEDVPGGNIAHLGALTFPVYADIDHTDQVGSRFVLMPGSVSAGQPFLGRITRHELTHVALADRDDGVPTWFAEGLAEYFGARDIVPSQRRIASVAVPRARQGVDGLPASATFNGPDQEFNYALAWMACDYIAATLGEGRLWELMDALHNFGDGTVDRDQDAALRRVLGYDGAELARQAAKRIVQIYG